MGRHLAATACGDRVDRVTSRHHERRIHLLHRRLGRASAFAEGHRPGGHPRTCPCKHRSSGDDDDYFESWSFFTDVSDWLRPLRGKIDKSIEHPFTTLFTAIGILFDDGYGPAAIKQGVQFTDSTLIAAISPAEVEKLLNTVRALDRRALEREFGRVLAESPCPGLPNGKIVVEWVNALDAALSSVGKAEGILILCPA